MDGRMGHGSLLYEQLWRRDEMIEQLRTENKRLEQENEKLRDEKVCHGDQCKLNEIDRLQSRLAEAEELLEQTIIYLCYDGSIKAGITQEKIEAFLGKEWEEE